MKNILDTMIQIPVSKPTDIKQCGTWSIIYPAEWTKKRKTK